MATTSTLEAPPKAGLGSNSTGDTQPISRDEAAARFRAQRQTQNTLNPVSEAARTLGQRAAEARQARQAQATAPQEAPQGAEQNGDDTGHEPTDAEVTDDQLHPEADQTAEQGATTSPDLSVLDDTSEVVIATDAQGQPVTMTAAEIRNGILRQADYTQKTTVLANERRAFETDRQQRLQLLDALTAGLRAEIGQPKPLTVLIGEHGSEEGIRLYAAQQERFEKLSAAEMVRQREQSHDIGQRKISTMSALSSKYGDKAQGMFDTALAAAKQATGLDEATLTGFLVHPAAVEFVADALAYRAVKAGKPKVTHMVAGKPAVVRPGAKVTAQAGVQDRVQRAEATLKASGKLADAVALLRARRG